MTDQSAPSMQPEMLSCQSRNSERTLAAIESHLLQRHGPLLDGEALAEALRFPTLAALERSHQRGHLKLALAQLPHRRGLFVLAHEVARYLVESTEIYDFDAIAETGEDVRKERGPSQS